MPDPDFILAFPTRALRKVRALGSGHGMANWGPFWHDEAQGDGLVLLTRPELEGSLLTLIRKFFHRYFTEGARQDWVSISIPDSAG